MKTVTFNIGKGGTGKSTIAFNFIQWLANEQGKKVLAIDGDYSTNLTNSLSTTDRDETVGTVYGMLSKPAEKVIIHQSTTNPNILYIEGSSMLTDDRLNLRSQQNNCMKAFIWLLNAMKTNPQVQDIDYIVIDTHNSCDLVTSNFLAISDLIVGVCDPSKNSFDAWLQLQRNVELLKEELVDPVTGTSYVDASLGAIANRVDHLSRSSRDFVDVMSRYENYLGAVQRKELMNRSLLTNTDAFTAFNNMSPQEKVRHQPFIDTLGDVFTKIKTALDLHN